MLSPSQDNIRRRKNRNISVSHKSGSITVPKRNIYSSSHITLRTSLGAMPILRMMTNGNQPQNRAWGKAKVSDFSHRLAAASPCTQPPGYVQGDGAGRRQIPAQAGIAPPTARLSSGGRSPSPQCAPRLGTPFAAGTQCPENDSPPLRGGEDVFGWRVQRQSVRQRGQAGGTPAQPQRGCPSAERAGATMSKWWKRVPQDASVRPALAGKRTRPTGCECL